MSNLIESSKKWNSKGVTLLRIYAFIIGYRFADYLPRNSEQNLILPSIYKNLDILDIKNKARGSITTAGVFFTFCVAVLVALIGTKEIRQEFSIAFQEKFSLKLIVAFPSMIISFVVIWLERYISSASMKKEKDKIKNRCQCWLCVVLILSILFYIILPIKTSFGIIDQHYFYQAFLLSGLFLIIISAFFLLLAIQFYDTASGWRKSTSEPTLHFHLAIIASHSTTMGMFLALVGISQLLCFINFLLGSIVTVFTLIVLTLITEFERVLWDTQIKD